MCVGLTVHIFFAFGPTKKHARHGPFFFACPRIPNTRFPEGAGSSNNFLKEPKKLCTMAPALADDCIILLLKAEGIVSNFKMCKNCYSRLFHSNLMLVVCSGGRWNAATYNNNINNMKSIIWIIITHILGTWSRTRIQNNDIRRPTTTNDSTATCLRHTISERQMKRWQFNTRKSKSIRCSFKDNGAYLA